MKILQIVPTFSVSGGSQSVLFNISKELVRRGHDVVVYTSDMKNLCSRVKSNEVAKGIKIVYFRNISTSFFRSTRLIITPKMMHTLYKEIQNFDIVHLHEARGFQHIVVHYYAKKRGMPYILQVHGCLPRTWLKRRKWIYDVLFGYRILKDATKVIALSKVELEQYKEMGVPEEKIRIIPNGIDLLDYSNLPSEGSFRRKYNIREDEKIVLYLGRLHSSKGIELLIKSFSVLHKRLPDTRLVLAGLDDGYLNEIKNMITHLDIVDKTVITGFLSNKDKLSALVEADVFVTPKFSGFPVTFLESCVAGTPIITTTLGDSLDWIDDNGIVVRVPPTALTEAIYEMLKDKGKAEEIGLKARQFVKENFTIEKIVDKLEKLYEEIMNG